MASKITRREMLKDLGLAAGAVAVGAINLSAAQSEGAATMEAAKPYALPPLPYAYNALEPVIGQQTLQLHHDKHHQAYVDGLNAALKKLSDPEVAKDPVLSSALAGEVAFNGSGHVLHSLYWANMKAPGESAPSGPLAEMIQRDFGSVDAFRAQFAAITKKVQGSGWGVLTFEPMGRRLAVVGLEKHENRGVVGVAPLLICDVWEHAYYLNYQNKRPDYVDAFVKQLINWNVVGQRLEAAMKQ